MSLQVYKNATDQILLGSSGNVFRVPYNFTNGFQNSAGISNYIKITGLSFLPLYHTVVNWFYETDISTVNGRLLTLKGDSGDNYNILKYSTSGYFALNNTSGSPSQPITPSVASQWMSGLNFKAHSINDGTLNQHVVNGTTETNMTTSYPGDATEINDIYISAIAYLTASTTPTQFTSTVKFGAFYLFDRPLSASEITYMYNNMNGSEPQSSDGLLVYFSYDMAEILDFSGNNYTYDSEDIPDDADFAVGVRDQSGNANHGTIENLASGTLAEQLEFANTYLFSSFLG